MLKNIILSSLAIIFIILIISYILCLNNIKLLQNVEGMSISQYMTSNPTNTPDLLNAIDATLDLQSNIPNDPNGSGVVTTNIIQNLMSLPITDISINNILKDTSIIDTQKIIEIRKRVKHLRRNLSADGLVLHYTLDEIQSNGTILNVAPETMDNPDYNGRVYGAKIDTSNYKYGKGSMRFRYDHSKHCNTTDYIKIPKIPRTFHHNGNFAGFTFATWYKTTTNSKPWARLFEFAVGGGGNHTIVASTLGDNTNYLFVVHGDNWDRASIIFTENALPTDTWIHIATTISSDGVYTNYLNGVKMQSNYPKQEYIGNNNNKSIVANTEPNTQGVRVPEDKDRYGLIGHSIWYHCDGGFDGWMNDFRIYRKQLTSTEISSIYNLGKDPTTNHKWMSIGNNPSMNLQIHYSAKNNNRMNLTQNINQIIWNDITNGDHGAYSSDANVSYCPKNEKITIPSGSHLEINQDLGSRPFTIAVVANVKTFNPRGQANVNYLLGSVQTGDMELFFVGNNLHFGTTNMGPYIVYQMPTMGGYSNVNADAVNIFIVKIDANNNASISFNGRNLITSKQLPNNWKSAHIFMGRGPNISTSDMDFYEFMYFGEHLDNSQQQKLEGYLAETWGLVNNLPSDHSYFTK